jgi:KDO2-lipid IV(A) lauroyltransferase
MVDTGAGVLPSVQNRAEYYALRATIATLERLPWTVACAAGERLAELGYKPFGIRRGIVERQVAAAFPEKSGTAVLEIARNAYRHLGRTTIESALLPSIGRERVLDLVEALEGWEILESAVAQGRGVILVTGHLGNWELGGAYIAARGIPVGAIVRRMTNPLFERYLNETRRAMGTEVIHDADAVRRAPRALREGKMIAFLSDQGVKGLASTFVPFFGRPAKTPRGPAVFALRMNLPVVFGAAIRQPSGRYRFSFEAIPVTDTGDRDADIDRIVAAYTQVLERWVRAAPEQYFWHHRRWRRQPPGTPPELREP